MNKLLTYLLLIFNSFNHHCIAKLLHVAPPQARIPVRICFSLIESGFFLHVIKFHKYIFRKRVKLQCCHICLVGGNWIGRLSGKTVPTSGCSRGKAKYKMREKNEKILFFKSQIFFNVLELASFFNPTYFFFFFFYVWP